MPEMTAARKLNPTPETAMQSIDFARLVPLNQAATDLGVTERHLRRLCCEQLAGRGLARQVAPPGGGKVRWYVDRAYDPRLCPGRISDSERVDAAQWEQLSARQRAAMVARKRCVETFRHANATWPGKQRDWIGDLIQQLRRQHPHLKISERSLRRWHADYQRPSDIFKLADARGRDQKSQGDPACWAEFERIFLDDREPTKRSCWKRVDEFARAQGLPWCSYKSLLGQLDERIPPERQVYHRDRRKWRSLYAPYIEQDAERFAAGECWMGDHRPFDVLVRIGDRIFRPHLTAWQDWRTRKIVGYVVSESPNSSTILAALRQGMLDESNHGGPSIVWIDNGKDFASYSFHGKTKQQRRRAVSLQADEDQHRGIYDLLGIESHFSIPYGPQGKARVEAVFTPIAREFDKTFATYTGNTTTSKPEGLADIVKRVDLIPTFDHLVERFGRYVAGFNARTDHSIDDLVDGDGQRLSPAEAMRRWCTTSRVYADPAALDLCLQSIHQPVPVGRNGIAITVGGQRLRYGQFDEALRRFKGTKRRVNVTYDGEDLRQIRVYDEQWRLITEAQLNATGGRHHDPLRGEHLRRLSQRSRSYRKSLATVADNRDLEYLSTEELLAEEAAKAPKPTQTAPDPAAMKLVQTPLDGASKDAEKQQIRQAAGAETSGGGGGAGGSGRALESLSSWRDVAPKGHDPSDDDEEVGEAIDITAFREAAGSTDDPADDADELIDAFEGDGLGLDAPSGFGDAADLDDEELMGDWRGWRSGDGQ